MYENNNEVNEVMVNPEVETKNDETAVNGKDFMMGLACGAAIVGGLYGIYRAGKRLITSIKAKKIANDKAKDILIDEDIDEILKNLDDETTEENK